jgi:hypothetical protein
MQMAGKPWGKRDVDDDVMWVSNAKGKFGFPTDRYHGSKRQSVLTYYEAMLGK